MSTKFFTYPYRPFILSGIPCLPQELPHHSFHILIHPRVHIVHAPAVDLVQDVRVDEQPVQVVKLHPLDAVHKTAGDLPLHRDLVRLRMAHLLPRRQKKNRAFAMKVRFRIGFDIKLARCDVSNEGQGGPEGALINADEEKQPLSDF